MMSIAAAKAGWQLVSSPAFWEKTMHGLYGRAPQDRQGEDRKAA
jgi:hypothetical protein